VNGAWSQPQTQPEPSAPAAPAASAASAASAAPAAPAVGGSTAKRRLRPSEQIKARKEAEAAAAAGTWRRPQSPWHQAQSLPAVQEPSTSSSAAAALTVGGSAAPRRLRPSEQIKARKEAAAQAAASGAWSQRRRSPPELPASSSSALAVPVEGATPRERRLGLAEVRRAKARDGLPSFSGDFREGPGRRDNYQYDG
jgi:hypothetical protein